MKTSVSYFSKTNAHFFLMSYIGTDTHISVLMLAIFSVSSITVQTSTTYVSTQERCVRLLENIIKKSNNQDTIVNQGLRLNGEDIKRSSEFCYLGSTVAENGGTSREVNVRIQKARGSFSKLRKVWLSKSLRKDN